MADTTTVNLGLIKPQPGASRDTWGTKTNENWDDTDAVFAAAGTGTPVGLHIGSGKKLVIDGTVEGTGKLTAANIADGAVTYAKIQDVTGGRILGNPGTTTAPVQEIVCTAQGRAILNDVTPADQRATIGAPGLSANTFTDTQSITSTNDGNLEGPRLELDRISATPAVDDALGTIWFLGRNNGNTSTVYADFRTILISPTNGDEAGAIEFRTRSAGTVNARARIGLGYHANNLTDMGQGTINAEAYYLNGGVAFALPRGHIDGFILTKSGSSDLSIGRGQAISDDGTTPMSLSTALIKQLTPIWAVGSSAGGRDAAPAKTNNTWYHVFVIMRPDTGVVDALFSLSSSAPTLPTNYTKQRRVGAVRTDGTGAITAFDQIGDEFEWDVPVADLDDITPLTTAETRTLTVPTGVRVLARITPCMVGSSSNATNYSALTASDVATQDPSSAVALTAPATIGGNTNWTFGGEMYVRTNNSAQIRSRAVVASGRTGIITRGWKDLRGRDSPS